MRMIDDNVKQKLDPLSFKGQLKAYIQSKPLLLRKQMGIGTAKTKTLALLELLNILSETSYISQVSIAKTTNSSASACSGRLKYLREQGYVEMLRLSTRKTMYRLTRRGALFLTAESKEIQDGI